MGAVFCYLSMQTKLVLAEQYSKKLRIAILKHQATTRYSDTPISIAICDNELYEVLSPNNE